MSSHYAAHDPQSHAAADALVEAIVNNRPPALLCPDCRQPMRTYWQQGAAGRPAYVLAECKQPDCDLKDVTLSQDQWSTLSDVELEAYRVVVRKLRQSW